jgi:carbonic anhydrase
MDLKTLIEGNNVWRKEKKEKSPGFFKELASGQHPDILWIGCSDSRVDPQEIAGQTVGSIFVQRNIANLVVPTDENIKAVVNYAVTALKVKHIIICGHYQCGGVQGALEGVGDDLKAVATWLMPLKAIYDENRDSLNAIEDVDKRLERLVELNVEKQVENMASLEPVQKRWAENGELTIHGAVFQLCQEGGKLESLNISVNGNNCKTKGL